MFDPKPTRSKYPTKKELALLSDGELVNLLKSDTAHGVAYRRESDRRMLHDGYTDFNEWIIAPYRDSAIRWKKKYKASQKATDIQSSVRRETQRSQSSGGGRPEPYETAQRAYDAYDLGWELEFPEFREPDKARGYIRQARKYRTTWAEVEAEGPPERVRAMKAFFSKLDMELDIFEDSIRDSKGLE